MGAGAGLALKSVQWFIRGVQFCCAAVILGIYSYFLAALHNHDMTIANSYRAVEGISGAAVLYTIIGLLLLCCLAGHPFTSFIAILLDILFVVGMVYIAVTNRNGASSCRGTVTTVFGTGDADTNVSATGQGFTALPRFRTACRLETAVLAVSIIAAVFFVLSALLELALVRHRRKERRFGPSPANNYTSGYGAQGRRRGFNFFGLGRRRRGAQAGAAVDPNGLPAHTHPDQVRDSYATEQTRVGTSHGAAGGLPGAKHETGYGHTEPGSLETGVAPAHYPQANYQYEDGVYNRS